MPDYANPQSLNRYSYVINNPLRYTDPTGHRQCQTREDCDDMGTTPMGQGASNKYRKPKLKPDDEPQTDVTEWLARELESQTSYVQQTLPSSCADSGADCGLQYFGSMMGTHFYLFGDYGRYDIKREMQTKIGDAVVLCGNNSTCRWVDYSTPGNIMYGYLSGARGVPQEISWIAGGILETIHEGFNWDNRGAWFDNPGDKAAVDFGYSLYESSAAGGLTVTEFQSALTSDLLDSFQSPPSLPIGPPLPQLNTYAPGEFLDPVRP